MRIRAALLGILCLFCSCTGDAPVPVAKPLPPVATAPPIAPVPVAPNPTADRIKDDQAAVAAAKKQGDLVKQLEAQKQEALDEATAAEKNAVAWRGVASDLTGSITTAKNAVLASKARWIAAILFGMALIGIIVAIWLPLARSVAGRLAGACFLGGVAALVFASIVPYLIWFGITIAVGGIIYGIVQWHKTHTTLTKVVQGVENAKAAIPEFAAKYAPILSTALGPNGTELVSQIRDGLGASLKADVEAAWKKI